MVGRWLDRRSEPLIPKVGEVPKPLSGFVGLGLHPI